MRSLPPGGTIVCTETDYSTFLISPSTAAFEALARAQYDWFAAYGDPIAGRRLGALLTHVGFSEVRTTIPGFHFFNDGSDRLRAHVEYVRGFLEPALEEMAARLDLDLGLLRRGLNDFVRLPTLPLGAATQIAHRAFGQRTFD